MAKEKKKSKLKVIVLFFVFCVILGSVYYLYAYTNVFAKLLGKEYEITFVVDGKEYKQMVKYDTLPVFEGSIEKAPTEKVEYVFDGWEPQLSKVEGEATYTAKFKEIERLYTVSIITNYENGGTFSGFGKIYPYKSSGEISVEANLGYVFKGWYINNELKTLAENIELTEITQDVQLEARFETIKRTITYHNLKDSTNNNPTEYDITFGTFDLKKITSSGWKFVGWFTEPDGAGEKIESIDSTKLNNYVLYAHWSLEAVVKLNVDGKDVLTIPSAIGEVVSLEDINLNFKPQNVGMSGYSVKKWYSNQLMTSEYDFSSEIEDDITLYGKYEYLINEVYFYPYLTEFNNACKGLELQVNSHDELVAWIDYVRFYDVTANVKLKLSYVEKDSGVISSEISLAYDELIEKTTFFNGGMIQMSATSQYGMVYLESPYLDKVATISADINREKTMNQQDFAFQVNDDDSRGETYDLFNINNVSHEISVSTSEQLLHVLNSGYKPVCVENSKAEIVYNKAKSVLREICDDTMSDFEKIRAIYEWIVLNVEYDYAALEIQTDHYKYDAWYAEGVFNNGVAVCEGFAKAFVIMTQIENIPSVIVTGNNHAWNRVLCDGEWFGVDATHGSPKVGSLSSEILTYTSFMFSDSYKTGKSFSSEDYSSFVAKDESVFNVYEQMDYVFDNQKFDLNINSLDELVLVFKYAMAYIQEIDSTYVTFEISNATAINIDTLVYNANTQTGAGVTITFSETDAFGNDVYSLKFVA